MVAPVRRINTVSRMSRSYFFFVILVFSIFIVVKNNIRNISVPKIYESGRIGIPKVGILFGLSWVPVQSSLKIYIELFNFTT